MDVWEPSPFHVVTTLFHTRSGGTGVVVPPQELQPTRVHCELQSRDSTHYRSFHDRVTDVYCRD